MVEKKGFEKRRKDMEGKVEVATFVEVLRLEKLESFLGRSYVHSETKRRGTVISEGYITV